MTVVLTGLDLSLEELVRVAREAEDVELAETAIERMAEARAVAERAIAGQETVYGVTTGVGVRKLFAIEAAEHDRLLVRQHLIGQGVTAPHDAVRATALRLANGLASGRTTARPELAAHVVRALNDDRLPPVRLLGSIGISDLAPLADLAEGILDGFPLEQGEAIALLNQSAFSTGIAALALHDALVLLDALDLAGALDYEAFAANRDALHPAIGVARPSAGLQSTLARISGLLEGSGAQARALQDPLSFRALAQLHGATRDAFGFVRAQVELELNAAQSNPLVLTDEDRVISVGNFEVQSLATALDLARLALAPMLSSAAERSVKLLQASLTGLSEGLGARAGLAESALSEYGIAVQAFASEARLLAQPVSLDLVSTTQAEGIEDRMTMAPLAARRLGEMVELGARVVSVELLLAAQACDLRGAQLAAGTARLHRAVRNVVPFVGEGDPLPDLEPLVTLIRSGGSATEMPVIDVHQHLLPSPFIDVLRRRSTPPQISGGELRTAEGLFPFDPADHDLETRIGLLDGLGTDVAVLSLQQTFGQDTLAATERAELVAVWEDGIGELVGAAGGRLAALAAGPARAGFAGSCVGSDAFGDLEALEPVLGSLADGRGFLFVHPSGGAVPRGAPPWWGALALYTAQMQEAYLRWLSDGQERWPDVRVVFAILAGGGPFQLERLASRGVQVRSALHGNVFFDTASYGRRALELCIETFGVEQLVYGSDVPVVDPAPTRLALKGFGESVERLITQDTPDRLIS